DEHTGHGRDSRCGHHAAGYTPEDSPKDTATIEWEARYHVEQDEYCIDQRKIHRDGSNLFLRVSDQLPNSGGYDRDRDADHRSHDRDRELVARVLAVLGDAGDPTENKQRDAPNRDPFTLCGDRVT